MSKIQDALQRFQAGNPRRAGNRAERIAPRVDISTTETSVLSANEVVDIDLDALRDAGLLASKKDEKQMTNQFRDIKRPLIASALGRRGTKVDDGNLIVVTSAISGEGKTFMSLNIALSIAREQDLSVLLVDADVAKPHISNVFGLSESPGLLDLLDGTSSQLEDVVYPTNVDGMCILPAGVPRQDASELLSGSRMENLVRRFADQDPNRFIIFDTPPLLQSSESKVILGIAGQVVLVVKAESTTQGTVGHALQELDDRKAVNLVLNQARANENNQYSYGYGNEMKDVTPTGTSKESVFDP